MTLVLLLSLVLLISFSRTFSYRESLEHDRLNWNFIKSISTPKSRLNVAQGQTSKYDRLAHYKLHTELIEEQLQG